MRLPLEYVRTCVSEWRLRFSVWRRVKGGAIRVWWNHFVGLTVITVECCKDIRIYYSVLRTEYVVTCDIMLVT